MKQATNIDQQIDKLTSRGMTIDNPEKAKENLLDIGYFRLGFYWFPFEKSYPRKIKRDHSFQADTKFEYAIELYYFDFDLRNLFLRYISRIEINFRTKLIYYVSNQYADDPYWYLSPKVIKESYLKSDKYQEALREVKKETLIKHDLSTHSYSSSPAWKVLEFMSFGTITSIYDNLIDDRLKQRISLSYKMAKPTQFSNYINTVRRLRNACAHGKVLFDINLSEAISDGPLGNLGARKTMLSGAYMVFKYLLGCISQNRVNSMRIDLTSAFDSITYKRVSDIIINNSGLDLNNL